MLPPHTEEHQSSIDADQDDARSYTTTHPVGKSVDWSEAVDSQQTGEYYADIMNRSLVLGGLDR